MYDTSISRSETCSGVGLNKLTVLMSTTVLVDKLLLRKSFRNPIFVLIRRIILKLLLSYINNTGDESTSTREDNTSNKFTLKYENELSTRGAVIITSFSVHYYLSLIVIIIFYLFITL